MDWFEKLKQAKEILANWQAHGAEALLVAADAIHKIEEGIREASVFLNQPVVMACDGGPTLTDKLEGLKADCEALANPPVGAAVGAIPPELLPLLASFLTWAVEAILKRLQDR